MVFLTRQHTPVLTVILVIQDVSVVLSKESKGVRVSRPRARESIAGKRWNAALARARITREATPIPSTAGASS